MTSAGDTALPRGTLRQWWHDHVRAEVDRQEVVGRVRDDAGWSSHYLFMLLMSAGIAVLGLLQSSPAVVIGAMLISPLMGPIIGIGFAVATFDSAELRRAGAALALGVVIAVLFCTFIVAVSPLQTVTSEIAARTRPTLFDLLVALFSGLAGSYATIRGRHGAIVGVAIATALMPPLAVVGFGLATANWTVFGGSLLLFFTNLMTIAASAAVLARLYGFATALSPRQTRLQAVLVIGILIALAVPLGHSLRQIAWEAVVSRQAREIIAAPLDARARISRLDIDFAADPVSVAATVFTPGYRAGLETQVSERIEQLLRRPARVSIDQVLTQGPAEAAQVAAARSDGTDIGYTRVAERLALVAGVAVDQVTIDAGRRRATVTAAPLPGAIMASYRALEQRVAALDSQWRIRLVPPPAALPSVAVPEGTPDAQAIATAVWAAQRLRLPIGARGADGESEAVLEALVRAGVVARRVDGDAQSDGVDLLWLAPEPPPAL